jgi:hypothetical protein
MKQVVAEMIGARIKTIGKRGDDVLLQRELDTVSQTLNQTKGAHAVGSDAHLHTRHDATFKPNGEKSDQHEKDKDHQ